MVAPVVAAAGISAVGSLLGGLFGGGGSKKAARIQQQTSREQIASIDRNRDFQYGLNTPTIERGGRAEGTIAALLGLGGDTGAADRAFADYRGSTAYTSRLAEGLGAVNNRSFAGGAGMSGANLKALQDRGHMMMGSEFDRYLAQLGGLGASGSNARGLVAGVGNNAVNQFMTASQRDADVRGEAARASGSNTQAMIQNLINAGLYAYGSSYGGGRK